MYRYLGVGRLQLWLASPNVCATWLVMTILLSIGVFLVCRDRKNWWGYTLAGVAAGWVMLQQLMLTIPAQAHAGGLRGGNSGAW